MPNAKHPVMLIVLDGWGHSEDPEYNAILAARIAGRTDEAIRALVVELTAKRASCA